MTAAFGQRHSTPQPPAAAPPPKKGLSGCALAAIIGAALVVIGIPVIAILAAIAIPQYQEYVVRSKVQAAYVQAVALQAAVDSHRQQTGECPDNAALGLDADTDRFGPEVASVQIGAVESGNCAYELTFGGTSPYIAGKTLLFESTTDGWSCKGGTLSPNHRPLPCR